MLSWQEPEESDLEVRQPQRSLSLALICLGLGVGALVIIVAAARIHGIWARPAPTLTPAQQQQRFIDTQPAPILRDPFFIQSQNLAMRGWIQQDSAGTTPALHDDTCNEARSLGWSNLVLDVQQWLTAHPCSPPLEH